MKESELAWVGPIPPQWHRQPLKTLFHQHKEKNTGVVETNLLSLSYGRIVRRDINQRGGLLPESFESYNIVSDGDIVLRLTDLQNDQKSLRTGLVREKGIITSAYIILRANYSVNTDYFQALLESYDYKKVFYSMGGGVRQGLNYDDISSLSLLVPPASEQCSIAEFIYYKRTEIDWLIEKLRRQVELLERYRRELIACTVTRGLDPDVPMRDSGFTWIGRIPEHWTVEPQKRLLRRIVRPVGQGWREYRLLSMGKGGVVARDVDSGKGKFPASFEDYQEVRPGEIVMCLFDMDETPRTVGLSGISGMITGAYNVFQVSDADGRFVNYWLRRLDDYKLWRLFYRSLRKTITPPRFLALPIPLPPLSEQRKIADFLDGKMSELDATSVGIKRQIELLSKYRKQVINDAVTGKVRVEGAE